MLLLKGYTSDGEFITNDPGTRNGRNYVYKQAVLMAAIHDWNGGDVMNGVPVVIVYKSVISAYNRSHDAGSLRNLLAANRLGLVWRWPADRRQIMWGAIFGLPFVVLEVLFASDWQRLGVKYGRYSHNPGNVIIC